MFTISNSKFVVVGIRTVLEHKYEIISERVFDFSLQIEFFLISVKKFSFENRTILHTYSIQIYLYDSAHKNWTMKYNFVF